tara:strand:- start:1325 stop:1729 length:405 start_codon:yes stop_codon:yes gene_type:complete
MYNYYFCFKINDEFYNHKLDLDKLSYLIEKYDLKCKGDIKEYWINNIRIISNDNIQFNKIIDKDVYFTDNYLIQQYDILECNTFSFYESHLEEKYVSYENIINDIKIIVKKYDNFITLTYESENNIDNNFLYYI